MSYCIISELFFSLVGSLVPLPFFKKMQLNSGDDYPQFYMTKPRLLVHFGWLEDLIVSSLSQLFFLFFFYK